MISRRDKLEQALTHGWYAHARWLWLLLPLTGLFAILSATRRLYWRQRIAEPLPVPVVVVGGITVGGTGKTPVLISLTQCLQAAGMRVAVVCRGYGGQVDSVPVRVTPNANAATVGDEPLLIAQRTNCPVFVCRDRSAAVRLAAREGADIVLSDDGLQHYAMHRDWEIIVLDAARGTGNGALLPAGPLREGRWRLNTVNWVLERNGKQRNAGFFYQPTVVRHLASGQQIPLSEALKLWHNDHAIAALTGLGQPEQFFTLLEKEGFFISRHSVGDHRAIDSAQLKRLTAPIIVMTEKDAVKLAPPFEERLWCLQIDAVLPEDLLHSLVDQFRKSDS